MSTSTHHSPTYTARRSQLETYFDRTAVEAWARLTTDAPVSRIRATVRAGRDEMRTQLLDWLPADLSGRRILDAGCGTGAFAVEAARRGADVVAIDLSGTLVRIAAERLPSDLGPGSVRFAVGDMLDAGLGRFDHVVAMDSLIYHPASDVVRCLRTLGERTTGSILFTFAPRTTMISAMYGIGKLFPRADRSPAIVPLAAAGLTRQIASEPLLAGWTTARTRRIARGFYISQAMELVRR
ncbi:MAG: magnesium protoporphyrin IX methyltransferase [Beijerinckiaceae bacterium]|jgi:magnesium-protoporphyrin O-methyltransferase|nr:magnesium protoporphyrin IX methyltransferase [Beijerinckiaceae bacterium]